MNTPISVVPGTTPPRFRWRHSVNGQVITQEGMVNPSMEGALVSLINTAKKLAAENEELRKQIAGHCDRIAAQSEILSSNAEKNESQPSRAQRRK